MRVIQALLLIACSTAVWSYKNPYYWAFRSINVHLFEWTWDDIADECERFLGPRGFGGVQISPPNENVMLWSIDRTWWERYQPMSYRLVTRSGNEQQLASMLRRCNDVGVRIYADIVINHMTRDNYHENVGTAGSTAIYDQWYYPAVPFRREHFNYPHCVITDADYQDPVKMRNCELMELKDLNQADEYVRQTIVDFMNHLIDLGMGGFRIDAAKHIWPQDLQVIFDRLNNLNTDHGFPPNSRPYIYQEVLDFGDDPISREEYTPIAAVTEFRVGTEMRNLFLGDNQLRWLRNWGEGWDLMNSGDALTFIDNHDNERGHGIPTLNYKDGKPYRGAVVFILAHPYGEPQIMSSYDFWRSDHGPPMDSNWNVISPSINSDGSCGNGWICQHRWRQFYGMLGFRRMVGGTGVSEWWDNESNQIAFCRGNNGFIAFNHDMWDLNTTLQTCLPAGTYCDVISGEKVGNSCPGKSVTVGSDGRAQIYIGANDFDMMVAIHVGPESRL